MFSTAYGSVDNKVVHSMSTDFRSEEERESLSRTGAQWLRSIQAYLLFRAGTGWRRMSDMKQRTHPQYTEYLLAARLITDIL
jgi:hypothetical protein